MVVFTKAFPTEFGNSAQQMATKMTLKVGNVLDFIAISASLSRWRPRVQVPSLAPLVSMAYSFSERVIRAPGRRLKLLAGFAPAAWPFHASALRPHPHRRELNWRVSRLLRRFGVNRTLRPR